MAKALTKAEIKKNLIGKGVRELKAFGFPKVNFKSIFTDGVYKGFFQKMLEKLKRDGQSQETETIIDELLAVLRKEAKRND